MVDCYYHVQNKCEGIIRYAVDYRIWVCDKHWIELCKNIEA